MDEAAELADAIVLNDDVVLAALRESIKSAYLETESLANGGAPVRLDPAVATIWDQAIALAWNRTRPTNDANAAASALEQIRARVRERVVEAAGSVEWVSGARFVLDQLAFEAKAGAGEAQ